MFRSQTLTCLDRIWIFANASSSDIEALPKRVFMEPFEAPPPHPVSAPGNTLMWKDEQLNCIDICYTAQVQTTAK